MTTPHTPKHRRDVWLAPDIKPTYTDYNSRAVCAPASHRPGGMPCPLHAPEAYSAVARRRRGRYLTTEARAVTR